jgi:HEAT repeat protein
VNEIDPPPLSTDEESPEELPSADTVIDQLESGDPTEDYSVLRGLSEIGDSQLMRLMALWPTFDPERRRELLAKLDQLASAQAVLDFHRIHLAALHDPDIATRILAVRGIAIEERPDYLQLLCAQLETDEAASVRAEIADVLSKWVVSMEFGLLSDEDAEELQVALTARVHDIEEDEEVRGRSLEALGACSDETVGELIGESYEVGSHRLRVAAIRAMGRSASETWLQILIFNFDDEDADIRIAAATASGALLVEEAATPLGMLLDDSELDVQIAAVEALGEIASDESERILIRLVRETTISELRSVAQNALAQVQLAGVSMLDDEADDPDFADADAESDDSFE